MLALACLHTMGKERCLLIGIGHYPSSTGWHEIGSVNDVKFLQKSMTSFSVQTLTGKEATHDGILASINRLFSEIEKGDTVLIHFSFEFKKYILVFTFSRLMLYRSIRHLMVL